jgi:hypothetical protein
VERDDIKLNIDYDRMKRMHAKQTGVTEKNKGILAKKKSRGNDKVRR